MKQDVIIRWLMDNVNAEELAQANENGTTIAYFAGVAQRFPANELQANNNARPRRNPPAVAEERDEQQAPQPARRQPARQPAAAAAVDLNNHENEAPPARQAARRPARPAAPAGEDRIRVGQY